MIRARCLLPFLLALLLICGIGFRAAAQNAPASAAAPAAASAAPHVAGLAPGDAAHLLGVLQDEAKRAELIRTLRALAAAQAAAPAATTPAASPAAAPAASSGATSAGPPAQAAPATGAATPAPAAATPATNPVLAPNTLGAQLLTGASERLSSLSRQIVSGAQAVTDLPTILGWASDLARDPVARARIADASWKLLVVLGLGGLAQFLVWKSLRRARARLDAMAPRNGARAGLWSKLRRVPLVLGRLLLDLVPVAAFAVASYALIGAVRPLFTTRLIMITAINAYLVSCVIMAAARMLLSPASAHLRLLPVSDETAAYIQVWLRRIVVVNVFGYSIAEAGLLFGLPWAAHDAILKLVALVVSLFLVMVVLQNRHAVAGALRTPPLAPGEAAHGGRRFLRTLRNSLAEVWHLLAILYLLAFWVVWALEIEDGIPRLLRVSAVTLLIVGAARLVDLLMRRGVTRGFHVGAELGARFPGLEARANRYLPVVRGGLSVVIFVITCLCLLEAWGVAAFTWFDPGRLGSRVISAVVSIGITFLLAILVWEAANTAMARYLARLQRDSKAARSARARTLLPMLRTALAIIIGVFVVLTTLSEIGINVAPLLAGAGVVSVAVAFGSQTLVKDVITGIFLLFEDAMAVGDTCTLGGLTGVVEHLSIRAIKLRALDGSVHIIPFSAVTSVTNATRDFGFAVVDSTVMYGENLARVYEAIRGAGASMRSEPRWGGVIRDDVDVMGVDKLVDNGMVVRARMKTDPAQRIPVQRELNRRVQERFEAAGIRVPSAFYKEPPAIQPEEERPAA